MKKIAIVILAAGKSSRMNAIKQLVKINNKTLLEITLEKVKRVFSENIFCVLGLLLVVVGTYVGVLDL